MSDDVRQALGRLVEERRESYASLSLLLGRNPAYLQQFVRRGSPRRLSEQDRSTLARYFEIDEALLGGPTRVGEGNAVRVPRLAVQASAGPGANVEGEFAVGAFWFDRAWLRQFSAAKPDELSIVTVVGDSMAPTLNDGDEVLVSRMADGAAPRDGIHVLRRDDALLIKRLTLAPDGATATISSDNPAYPAFRDVALDGVRVLGRVIWAGRRFG